MTMHHLNIEYLFRLLKGRLEVDTQKDRFKQFLNLIDTFKKYKTKISKKL